MKSIITMLRGCISPDKLTAQAAQAAQTADRVIKKRTVVILAGNGPEPFADAIGNRIDALGIDYDAWIVESLNPIFAMSSELKPELIDFSALSVTCRKCDCRFLAAYEDVEFGIIGAGSRMSFGSTTPLWSKLITAALQLKGSDCWVSGDLAGADTTKRQIREIGGAKFYCV